MRRLIVLEGGEGAGKSTVLKLVRQKLDEQDIPYLLTREPGGSLCAELIRDLIFSDEGKAADALTQFCLFWAARASHLQWQIRPALRSDCVVLSDRYDASTFAYQIAAKNGQDLASLFWTTREMFQRGMLEPLYIYLDVPPEIGLARVQSRGGKTTHFDDEKIDFHRRVAEGFSQFFQTIEARGGRVAVVNAQLPLEAVVQRVVTEILIELRQP